VAIWAHQDRQTAGEALDDWLGSVPPSMVEPFRELIQVSRSRREHILNYFEHRITNAYTESINRLAKSINRMGRGYTLEVVRAKLIYDTNARKKGAKVVPIHGKRRSTGGRSISYMAMFPSSEQREVVGYKTLEYGPHIPTLCDLLESGYFEQPAVDMIETAE